MLVEIEDLAGLPGPPVPTEIVATMRWQRRKILLAEGTSNQPLTVVLSRALPVEVVVGVAAVHSDGLTDDDYALSFLGAGTPPVGGFLVRIPAEQTTGFVNITVPVDATIEPVFENLTLTLQLYEETIGLYTITLLPSTVDGGEELIVRIFDQPAAPPGAIFWNFESDELDFNEDAHPNTTFARINFTGPTPSILQMRLRTTNGTAIGGAGATTPGADYISINSIVGIPPGSLSYDVPLRLINDTEQEGPETFTLDAEVFSSSAPVVAGVTTSTEITINASDIPTGPVFAYWDGNLNTSGNAEVTFIEGGVAMRLRIWLSAATSQNLMIPVTVVATSGVLSRITLAFPGGVFGTAVAQPFTAWTDIFLTVPTQQGTQAPMTYTLTLGAATGVVPGIPSVLELTVLDNNSGVLPEVAFRLLQQPDVVEGPNTERLIVVEVTNPTTANLTQGFTVGLSYNQSGGAVYGDDFRIWQTLQTGPTLERSGFVEFPANINTRVLRLRPTDDAVNESTETYQITLDSPLGCTIGSVPTTTGRIIDNDLGGAGTGLRPQFYFASEVLGQGPNVTGGGQYLVNLVADLGPGVTFSQDVLITMSHYSPAPGKEGSAVVSGDGGATGDFWFPDDVDQAAPVLRSPAGSRYGKLKFEALPDGVAGSRKHVVVVMASSNYGVVNEYWQQNKWVAVLCGAADNEGLVPTPTVPLVGDDDFKVYADRIEDIYHGDTYTFPFNPADAALVINYGASGILESYLTSVAADEYWNGVAIAAHLAQKVWLDRNGGVFGTRRVYVDPTNGHEVHYIEPAVRWLDVGDPVYISVFQQAINGPGGAPHALIFAGGGSYGQRSAFVNWGRGIATGTSGLWHPSMTRDLYITARGHQHRIKYLELGSVQKDTTPSTTYIQSFTDNLRFTGFLIALDPTITTPGDPLVDASQGVAGRQAPGYFRYIISQAMWHGHNRLHLWEWTTTTLGVLPTATFGMRVNNPGSWTITNCTGTRTQRQFAYFDSPGPIFVFAYNETPYGNGYSILQIVSRNALRTLNQQTYVGGSTNGPSHGLMALVENEHWGVQAYANASDFEIYGHLGYLFAVGNRHRGQIGYSRRMLTLLASGNEEGMYVAESQIMDFASEYAPDSPVNLPAVETQWFTARYVELRGIDVDVEPLGVFGWGNDAFVFAGCWRLVIRAMVNATSGTPMSAQGRAFFVFNPHGSYTLNWGFGAIMADPLNRPLFGEGYSSPPFPVFRNRGGFVNATPGGVSFPDGFDAIATSGAFCGSTSMAQHLLRNGTGTNYVPFSGLTAAQRNNYDGRDPGWGPG
jgi:hypothetical protein